MEAKSAAIYARISEHDPRVPKVQVQETSCRELAKVVGYEVVRVFVDDGISASTFKDRPGWSDLLAAARRGDFSVILSTEEERFTRQPMEKELLQLACVEGGVTWHTVRGGHVDPATADGEFFSTFFAAMARREVRRKSERQRAGNVARRQRGEPIIGNRPFGFEVDRITHREDEADLLRDAYKVIEDGGTIYSVLSNWNTRGVETARQRDNREKRERAEEPAHDRRNRQRLEAGEPEKPEAKGWSHQSVRQLLLRPANAGLVQDGRDAKTGQPVILEDVKAVWDPIVPREQWEAVRAILASPDRAGPGAHKDRWLCAGLAVCGVCGERMRSGRGGSKSGKFSVYRCRSRGVGFKGEDRRHPTIKTDDLDPLVRSEVAAAFMMTQAEMPSTPQALEVGLLHRRLGEVRQGRADLLELAGTPGFSVAHTAKRGAELAAEEARIEVTLAEHVRRSAQTAMLVESSKALFACSGRVDIADAVDLKTELVQRLEGLPLHQQRTLVRSMLSVTVNPFTGGKSADRVDVQHLRAVTLNADEWAAEG